MPPRRFPYAQTLDLYRVTNPPIKLHHLHPPPSAITPKGYLPPEFYSGATGLTGRFNEGFLLRRLHSAKSAPLERRFAVRLTPQSRDRPWTIDYDVEVPRAARDGGETNSNALPLPPLLLPVP